MDFLNKDGIQRLLKESSKPCVSIYLPIVEKGPETRQNTIRFKNAIRDAEVQLRKMVDDDRAESLLEPAKDLLEDTRFWSQQGPGLAVYLSDDVFEYYRMPFTVRELTTVTRRFHLKPALPLLHMDIRFHVLILSQNRVELLSCTPYAADVVDLPSVPSDMADALKYDLSEKQLQFHTGTGAGRGERSPAFHGHGVGKDDKKDQILRYCQSIDKGLREVLDDGDAPLVLACVDYVLPIYREANTYPHLMDEAITGNAEAQSRDELHKAAWEVVKPYFRKARDDAAERYLELRHTEKASSDLREILPSAVEGRVQVLFLDRDQAVWGHFDAQQNEVILRESKVTGDEDLMDLTAFQTLAKGGDVYAVEREDMPEDGPVLAVFRY